MIQVNSADRAKAYFADALSRSDYYIDDQELAGEIRGRLAARLGIEGPADRETFSALCDNVNPVTNGQLTPRQKEERIVGYDINFHCPKSVSIVHALSKDEHILRAFEETVKDTMSEIEKDIKTRVRTENRDTDRATGELAWGQFIHQTARPVDEKAPDPHLHAHCFVFNATFDPEENRIKAAFFRNIKRDMPYYQARFHKQLSDRLLDLGYEVRRTGKSFEVRGVPQKVIDLFSKRTDEIGRIAKEKGITDKKELDELGARTRSKKQKGMGMNELKAEWRKQIHELGREWTDEGDAPVRFGPKKERTAIPAKECVEQALLHGFERASVLQDRKLLAAAYRHAIGDTGTTIEKIDECLEQDERLIRVEQDEQLLCSTQQILSEELYMVNLARSGQGKLRPLYTKLPEMKLDGMQANAVRHVLTTPNRVSIIRGVAGSGKTTLMKEAISLMENAGKNVTVVAPTSQASRGVLKEEGFEKAQTVAKLLEDREMQAGLKNQVLWVDEAGLLGTKDMTSLLRLCTDKNARLILGGDTRQHSSVIRGDALRILNKIAHIKTAEVSKIYRQKGAQYRQTVELLSRGAVKQAFGNLDSMDAIQEIDPLNPNEALVRDYVDTIKKGKSALVISPTHEQGDNVTADIRKKMRDEGLLGKKEVMLRKLHNLNLTEAEKADWRNVSKGHIVQFNQNTPGIKRGSMWTVSESSEREVSLTNEEGKKAFLPQYRSTDYDVFAETEIPLSKGDTIRITRNGIDREKNRVNNGHILQVESVYKNGDVHLVNSISKATYRLPQDFGHISHAHCITSHASQGKTVDEVFISQPASTFGATDAKQMYVSVSRGREAVRIYTEDKEELIARASKEGDRMSAIELSRKKQELEEIGQHHVREQLTRMAPEKAELKETFEKYPRTLIDRDYEPGI